jgi:hypothetical protein
MIRRAISRSAAHPCPTAICDDTRLADHIDCQVACHNETIQVDMNLDRLCDEMRSKLECFHITLREDAPLEPLCMMANWLVERLPLVVGSYDRLQKEIQELKRGLTSIQMAQSFHEKVSELGQMLQAFEEASMSLGMNVDILKEGVARVCTVCVFPTKNDPRTH